jgi:hypothetical protein
VRSHVFGSVILLAYCRADYIWSSFIHSTDALAYQAQYMLVDMLLQKSSSIGFFVVVWI